MGNSRKAELWPWLTFKCLAIIGHFSCGGLHVSSVMVCVHPSCRGRRGPLWMGEKGADPWTRGGAAGLGVVTPGDIAAYSPGYTVC